MKKIFLLFWIIILLVSCWKVKYEDLSEDKVSEIDNYVEKVYNQEQFIKDFWLEKIAKMPKNKKIANEFLKSYREFFNESLNKVENKYPDIDFQVIKDDFEKEYNEAELKISEWKWLFDSDWYY